MNTSAFSSAEEKAAFVSFRVFVRQLAEQVREKREAESAGRLREGQPTDPATSQISKPIQPGDYTSGLGLKRSGEEGR